MNVRRAINATRSALVSRFVAGVAFLMLVFVLQLAISPVAKASGAHDHGYAAIASVIQIHDNADAGAVFDLPMQSVIAPIPNSVDCGDHGRHRQGPDTKSCCATACCATVAFVWQMAASSAPVGRVAPNWAFLQQFVVLDYASGLDRPPDFRA